jgi:hypothetical protein
MNITRPQNINFVDWSDQVAQDVSQYGVIPKVHSESEWQQWGEQITQLPQISRFNPPNPYCYGNWQLWADFLCKAIV